MKQAVVYFSKDGSTRVAARLIGEKFSADVFELKPKRPYGSGAGVMLRGGLGATFGTKPALEGNPAEKLCSYDKIYIGTPIWAWRPAPPVNTLVAKLEVSGKDIVLFSLQADSSAHEPLSGMIKLGQRLEQRGASVSAILRFYGAGVGKTVNEAEMKKRIDEKL